ncbi:hypothetical protein NLI96_g10226 [Meripilus lineatus]|uniref:Uncharacterized protein n=1 Tax=Meripilus lineatus TaxID=2056292 RepID=A0AAD5UU58_9APHY|nr:hypothetical protein NLI96_g10226 [Physisporinus lineatus]
MTRILSILPQCSPSLKRLFYDYSMPNQDHAVSNLLSTIVLKCPLLQEVSSGTIPFPENVFEYLAGLRALRTLESAIPTTGYPETRRSSDPVFSSLKTLDLQVTHTQHIQTLLERVGSRNLVHLRVEFYKSPRVTSGQFKSLLDLITQNQSSVRGLYIIHDRQPRRAPPQPNPDQNLSFTDIYPMVNKFPNMVLICLVSSNFAIDLHDDDLRAMALAWRSLKIFEISSNQCYSLQPNVTLRSLLAFATYCPDLEKLYTQSRPLLSR